MDVVYHIIQFVGTVFAAFVTGGIVIWSVRHPEAALLIGFGGWVLWFGWYEGVRSVMKKEPIIHVV